jgi:serine/threonine protein kinase/tetratricopeptide (TPR) repeat protein
MDDRRSGITDLYLKRWSEIGDIVLRAMDLPTGQRDTYLKEACGDDSWLRQAVEKALLANDESAQVPILEHAGRGALLQELRSKLAAEDGLQPGTMIATYRVLNKIGCGGMGVVYLAERADGHFHRRVAVKVLARGLESTEMTWRFTQERQILASLDHPAIARLLDAGLTPDSRPFFVMEHVEGRPIDRYCDEKRLSIEERLGLFRVVVDAVQYAHRNLVIHRDLKPANILVTNHGVVKLLDFGIAKVLPNAAEPGAGPPTHSTQLIMTPEYASPEQYRGLRVTTASDIYQLGLLLYELMCGQRPYHLDRRSQAENERAICELEPLPPSCAESVRGPRRRRSDTGEAATAHISRVRQTSVARLRRKLRGDLDNIVMMALRKEPERRYPSAERFGRDIELYLAGQPVAARKDTVVYRTRKYLRRHSIGVSFAVTLAVLAGLATWRLASERDRARMEAAKAHQVSGLLKDLLEFTDPNRLKGQEVSAEKLLEWGKQRLASDPRAQPEVQAAMMTTLGDIYRKRGMFEQAEALLERALHIRQRSKADDRCDLAETANCLAQCYFDQARYPEAEALFYQALDIRQQAFGADHPDVAATMDCLGDLFTRQARYAEARQLYSDALRIRTTVLGPDHPDVAESLANVAIVSVDIGQYSLAERQYRRALAITQQTLGADHPQAARIRTRIAYLSRARGEYTEAERLLADALRIRETAFGPEHPEVLASLNNLADHYQRFGRYRETEQLYARAMAIAEATLEADHPHLAAILNNLCALDIDQGRYSAAEPLCLRALEIRERCFRADHPLVASTLSNLARLREREGRLADADALHQRSMEICEQSPQEGDRAGELCQYAHLKVKRGLCSDSVDLFQRSLDIVRASASDTDFGSLVLEASIDLGLGEAHRCLGHHEQARSFWRQSVSVIEPVTQSGDLLEALDIKARALLRLERSHEAQVIINKLDDLGWKSPDLGPAHAGSG